MVEAKLYSNKSMQTPGYNFVPYGTDIDGMPHISTAAQHTLLIGKVLTRLQLHAICSEVSPFVHVRCTSTETVPAVTTT